MKFWTYYTSQSIDFPPFSVRRRTKVPTGIIITEINCLLWDLQCLDTKVNNLLKSQKGDHAPFRKENEHARSSKKRAYESDHHANRRKLMGIVKIECDKWNWVSDCSYRVWEVEAYPFKGWVLFCGLNYRRCSHFRRSALFWVWRPKSFWWWRWRDGDTSWYFGDQNHAAWQAEGPHNQHVGVGIEIKWLLGMAANNKIT